MGKHRGGARPRTPLPPCAMRADPHRSGQVVVCYHPGRGDRGGPPCSSDRCSRDRQPCWIASSTARPRRERPRTQVAGWSGWETHHDRPTRARPQRTGPRQTWFSAAVREGSNQQDDGAQRRESRVNRLTARCSGNALSRRKTDVSEERRTRFDVEGRLVGRSARRRRRRINRNAAATFRPVQKPRLTDTGPSVVRLATTVGVSSIPDAQQHSCSERRQVSKQDTHGDSRQDLQCERFAHAQPRVYPNVA